jgi:major membrane immunogen (membrane-anchored lipoprotein)
MKLKRIGTLAAALLLVLSAVLLTGCGEKQYADYSFDYFDTVTAVKGYAKSQEEFDTAVSEGYLPIFEGFQP